jgi:hypothetical protein
MARPKRKVATKAAGRTKAAKRIVREAFYYDPAILA